MDVAISHRLPGRIRLEIAGMQRQPILAYKIERALTGMDGILEVNCNSNTGRALIRFDESRVSVDQVTKRVERELSGTTCAPHSTVAATSEVVAPPSPLAGGIKEFLLPKYEQQTHAPVQGHPSRTNPYRLPTLASLGLLGFLGAKRFLIGRSVLAAAPFPFYAAAAGSIIAGYPFLRRSIEGPLHRTGANPDLLLGAVALGFAALRENLVALSAIAILNIAMYRRHQALPTPEATQLPPELERHSRNMTRAGFLLSPLTWLLTGSPLRALGVLLAANPRPATLAHKHAWARAEREAVEKQLPLPQFGHLENLAYAKTIVFANGTALTEDSNELMIQPIHSDIGTDKAAALATSLVEKIEGHPLRKPLLQSALQEKRTHRTAFQVEMSSDGVRGMINGHETLLGTKTYLKERNIDLTPVLLSERRMRREGYKPYILVQDGEVLALIGSKQQLSKNWRDRIEMWEQRGLRVCCLQEGERVPCQLDMMTPHELSQELERGRSAVIIGEHSVDIKHPNLVTLSTADVPHLDDMYAYCQQVQEQLKQDLKIVKVWNTAGIGLAARRPHHRTADQPICRLPRAVSRIPPRLEGATRCIGFERWYLRLTCRIAATEQTRTTQPFA